MSLELDGLEVRYGARRALRPTSLTLARGELVGLVGPNGAGKSSLLKAAAGVLRAGGGVRWQGQPLARMPALARARTVAYLPQGAAAHWPLTARDLVALGRLPHRAFAEKAGAADAAAIDGALAECDAQRFASRAVDMLSGGERARVLLARALAVRAPVLLADEPIQSLDPFHQLEIMGVLRRYAEAPALVVAVLHDLALAARFCTRIVLLSAGRVAADGPPGEVLTSEILGRHYRVQPYLASHDGQAVVLPWRQIR
ncbi:MAG TPA: ABC transporter ATP-binding protein [Gammaproteobacteria bacterium]|nr:ABC transporter ATP-binding protein [Gammaproteobacteria bacterium]